MTQLEFAALAPGSRNRICPNCKQVVKRVWTGDVAQTQLDLDPKPTTRVAALTAVVDGTPAVVARTTKRARGAGIATTWIRLTQSTIGSTFLADLPHHVAHRCGVTNPDPPPPQVPTDLPASPPF